MADWVGWLATAVFMTSYIPKRMTTLRRIQAAAACLWALYGVLIHSLPVIVANVLVATVAIASSFRRET
jgi:uncharacterized protein with PQ loop repeat